MKKPSSPCYKCEDRTPGCHGSCGKFASFHEDHLEYGLNILRNRHKDRPAVLAQHVYEGISKRLREENQTKGRGKCVQ